MSSKMLCTLLTLVTSTLAAAAASLTPNTTTTPTPSTSASDSCVAEPTGYGPLPTPNTAAAFPAFPAFASAANTAPTPPLYWQTYANLNGSQLATPSTTYLGYHEIPSYDPATCAALCDATAGCVGVNLYFERDPRVVPAAACPDPEARTAVKCALWGSPVSAAQAVNYGQWRESFHVLVGSSCDGHFGDGGVFLADGMCACGRLRGVMGT
ncbi:putative carbohydrate-binding -like protein [Teratosphaeria destructans]|uniref:Carbohydrate-binding -like protein n=1 Tax=Teratosphaeria destructans TaxID=418781 RepID=A0A9W7SW98_9PEZI|nr:putative carbohydrate-binding -like protein [Teratosphaeria destructans]